jgi:hypothetical protein
MGAGLARKPQGFPDVHQVPGGENPPPGFTLMGAKPLTRTELIQLVLYEADEASARQLLVNFPAMTREFGDLVRLVCQGERLSPDVFSTLSDAWGVVRPGQSRDGG